VSTIIQHRQKNKVWVRIMTEEKTLHEVLSKVPEVTLLFWIIKIAATTLGETAGMPYPCRLIWGIS
jgi:uncharacterized membrane-anchored protein